MKQINVYPYCPVDTEVEFSKGTVVFHGGSGWIANATDDEDGRFFGEATGPTQAAAVAALMDTLAVRLEAAEDAKPEQVQQARARIKETKARVLGTKLEYVSDGELGHIIREAMQEQESVKAAESRDAALADRALVQAEQERLRLAEAAERATWKPIPGYTLHGFTVPDLDMQDKDLNAVADQQTIVFYSALGYLSGRSPLDRDTTTWKQIKAIHVLLTPDRISVVLTAGQFAKAQTLVKVLGISEEAASARVLEMFPA